jgi:hypothetical protein
MNNQIDQVIYVNPNSPIGQGIARMGIAEETQIINSCKNDILSGKISKNQAIQELTHFMDLWKTRTGYSRTFYLIPKYKQELNNE